MANEEVINQIAEMNDEGTGEGIPVAFQGDPEPAGEIPFGMPNEIEEGLEPTAPAAEVTVESVEVAPTASVATVEGVVEVGVPLSELDQMRAQITALTGLVETLAGTSKAPEVVAPVVETGIEGLLADMNFDEIMESKEKFTGFISKLMKAVSEGTLATVHGVIPQVINQHSSMSQVRDAFYAAHPQLAPVKSYVSKVANEVAARNPEWNVQQVLGEAAKLTKAALSIQDMGLTPQPGPSAHTGNPVLPGGTARPRTPAPNLGIVQRQIDEMNDDL